MPHNNLKQIYAISYKENISVQNTLNISYKQYLKITKKNIESCIFTITIVKNRNLSDYLMNHRTF